MDREKEMASEKKCFIFLFIAESLRFNNTYEILHQEQDKRDVFKTKFICYLKHMKQ